VFGGTPAGMRISVFNFMNFMRCQIPICFALSVFQQLFYMPILIRNKYKVFIFKKYKGGDDCEILLNSGKEVISF